MLTLTNPSAFSFSKKQSFYTRAKKAATVSQNQYYINVIMNIILLETCSYNKS